MKERLPIWFQALALILLSGVFMASVSWVWKQDKAHPQGRTGAIINSAHEIIYLAMPVPLVYLGLRFLLRLVRDENANPVSVILGFISLVFVLPGALA
ncbi:MAG: hypothetical protein EXR98_13415 [Gemmataceae bacterium]|nr:hypothetical protein [Gemmataceae bacterium]